MVTLFFISDPRSSQGQVKKVKFRDLKNIFETYLYCPVLSQDSKNVICFDMRQLEIPKIAIQKSDVITFTWCFGHCTAAVVHQSLIICRQSGVLLSTRKLMT